MSTGDRPPTGKGIDDLDEVDLLPPLSLPRMSNEDRLKRIEQAVRRLDARHKRHYDEQRLANALAIQRHEAIMSILGDVLTRLPDRKPQAPESPAQSRSPDDDD